MRARRHDRRAAVPTRLPWVNVPGGQASIIQRGRPVLVEFWDFCRANSLRTLPYVKAWHERYADAGLRVDRRALPRLRAVARRGRRCATPSRACGIELPGADRQRASRCGDDYGNEGWPARYLFDGRGAPVRVPLRRGRLRRDRAGDPGAAGRRARAASRRCAPRTPPARCCAPRPRTSRAPTRAPTRPAACGRCSTASGTVRVNGGSAARSAAHELTVDHPGAYPLIEHERHTDGRCSSWRSARACECHATCFTPGLAPALSVAVRVSLDRSPYEAG